MSASHSPLPVVFCWHMHQPDYRGPDHSSFELPWVYLHGIKDYADMAYHLENNPEAKAVVNFAPILLEQLNDYVIQIEKWLASGKRIQDPLLAALAGPGVPLDQDARRELIRACMRANEKRLIGRFLTFQRLVEMARWVNQHLESGSYLNDQYLTDLLVWYHLAWMGESARTNDIRIRSLENKRKMFNQDDRKSLVMSIRDLLSGIVPRYRRLAGNGQIELSVTPYSHPMMPLLLDLNAAKEALPDVTMPNVENYPGGEERVRWQISNSIEVFKKYFGFRPDGCWPSEGGVSHETLRILDEEGFRWIASGQQVLQNSLLVSHNGDGPPVGWAHQPYRIQEGLNCFFRDDGLSDFIGFTYSSWHGDDAVADLIHHLEVVEKNTTGQENRVVSIIMDGENAWEHYPRNGSFFLDALYRRLSEHPNLELCTFSDCIRQQTMPATKLTHLVAGSWVYGNFATWIGDQDKNRAWEMLVEAKHVYDRVLASGRLNEQQQKEAEQQLATCEGSDWFWWFGDYNPGATVSDFERLFRRQLIHLYQCLGEEPPEYLHHVFAVGSGDPTLGGVMRRNR